MDDTEWLDVFDDDLNPLPPADRDTVHREGWWHQVFHCLVVRTTWPPRVLLQRRMRAARSFPGLLDLSATGHLSAGETPEDGVRELEEEIGVVVRPDQLVPIGTRRIVDDGGGGSGGCGGGEGRNREIVHAFLLPLDAPLDSFDLAGHDVDGLVEIDVADLLQILAEPSAAADALELDAAGSIRSVTVASADLVPDVDGYWVAVATSAARFVRGEPLSPI